jgi:hypothetical protein
MAYEVFKRKATPEETIIEWERQLNILATPLSGLWNGTHIVMGNYHIWIDATGDLRIKSSSPNSSTDGAVIGTQS